MTMPNDKRVLLISSGCARWYAEFCRDLQARTVWPTLPALVDPLHDSEHYEPADQGWLRREDRQAWKLDGPASLVSLIRAANRGFR